MKTYPFNTAYTQARDLYGVEITPDDFENLGMIAWGRIGNKYCRMYKYQDTPIQDELGNWYIDLPCNADIIEAITADYEDYQKTSSMSSTNLNQSSWVEDFIEARKYNTDFLYMPGKYVKYNRVDNRIYLSDKFYKVNVLYEGILTDEEGLPSLNEKEIDAIAAFCAYSKMFKRGLVTKDSATIQLAQLLEQKWKNLCTQARVPEYINQNEMDQILNVSASWDRKRFGKSFKPIR